MKTVVDSLLNDLGVAASIVIVAGAILGVYKAAVRIYSRTAGSRRDLARRLNELAAGVTLRYVEERFGTPAFSRTIVLPRRPSVGAVPPQRKTLREIALVVAGADATAASTQITSGQAHARGGAPYDGQPFRELVFREKHAWIQVLADDNDAVARFSITVSDPRFRFSVRDLTWGHLAVRLGHSRFSDVREDLPVSGRSLRIGAHNHEYAETYWFGNPGNYQHYVISSNEIGTGEFWFPVLGEGPSGRRSGILAFDDPQPGGQSALGTDEPDWSRFRAGTTVNTLTILGPARQPADLAEPRGPDSTHVRVLVPAHRERRQIRRRLRRISRQSLRASKTQPPPQAAGGVEQDVAAAELPFRHAHGPRPVMSAGEAHISVS